MKKLFLSALIAILCLLWYYYFMNSSKEVINEEQKEVAINVEEDDATMKKSTHLKFKAYPLTENWTSLSHAWSARDSNI